jgi:hypothetical protein
MLLHNIYIHIIYNILYIIYINAKYTWQLATAGPLDGFEKRELCPETWPVAAA